VNENFENVGEGQGEEADDKNMEDQADDNKGDEKQASNDKRKVETLRDDDARELWRSLDGKVNAGATILCKELRLVLEATERSGLGGDIEAASV